MIRNGASASVTMGDREGWILDAVPPPTDTGALLYLLICSSTRAVRVPHVGCRVVPVSELRYGSVLAAHRICGVPRNFIIHISMILSVDIVDN